LKFKRLSLKKNISNIKQLSFFVLLLTFIFVSPIHAATYNYYFSNAGGGSTCSIGSPCANLSDAQTKIDAHGSGDTVNLYFNRDDTWTMNTPAVAKVVNYGLLVDIDDPIVHIDAYGSGDKPKFYGNVSDFSSVPSDNTSTGPFRWNNVIRILRNDCSVKNMHIDGVYGHAIWLGGENIPTDGFTLESCDITNFGSSALTTSNTHATRDTTITKNLIHTGCQLVMAGKMEASHWTAAIPLNPAPNDKRSASGNVLSYNVLYDIGGEGFLCYGCIMEYNLVGNTSSIALFGAGRESDLTDIIIRYNLVTMSDWSTHEYDSQAYQGCDGIAVLDERVGGENSGATAEIYGNVVINRQKGIFFNESTALKGGPDPILTTYNAVRIYNNTVIDSHSYNYVLSQFHYAVGAGNGFFHNNTSILYDRTSSAHAEDWTNPADLATYWTINNNAFWTTGGSPKVDVDWQTNYVIADPKLAGEEKDSPVDWDGQSGATYYKDITFAHVTPNSDSGLIDTGKIIPYEDTYLSNGSDFSVLPTTVTFVAKQQSHDGKWDIGAIIFSDSEAILKPPFRLNIKIK